MFLRVKVDGITNPVILNTDNISSINDTVVKMNNCDIITLEKESMKELMLRVSSKTKGVENKEPKQELLELFEKLHVLTKGKGKPKFTLQREQKLNALLTKHRLTEEDLIRAATNIGNDDFLQGENEGKKRYGDIDYLLRPDKAAKWSDEQEKKKKGMF